MLKRPVLAIVAAGGVLVAATVLSCTVFNDVPLPRSGDAAAVEAGGTDAGTDGGGARSAGLLSLPDAVRVCSISSSCVSITNLIEDAFRLPIFEGYSYCVTTLSTTLEPERLGRATVTPILERLARLGPSATCEAAQREFELDPRYSGDTAFPASLCDGPNPRCLDGKTALSCYADDQDPVLLHHCERPPNSLSDSCLSYDGGATCGTSLDCGNDDQTCLGDVLRRCYGVPNTPVTYLSSYDCSAIGMRCVVGDFEVGCSTDGTIRKDDGSVRAYCDGTRYVTSAGFFFAAVDCASFGARCVAGPLIKEPLCVFDTDECSPFAPEIDRCADATTISLCVGGKKTTFDCASIGAVCAQGTGTYASCKIPP